ncbi:thermonuclease family protein [Alsobacter sp. SYSU M60028]|uniref:Thermonuclease family protein n=1 Tax=Alsobacter ponti TaxID=2962936 RepID=A0ABT1L8E5_9HYPH|nr:thermonuclease family protein [Alsobacter ponti]MCP8937659.1 thermonuclease family protein [Alsobacter ponti]
MGGRIVRRVGSSFWSGLALGAVAAVSLYLAQPRRQPISGDAVAIDGDSLRLGGVEIRLEGVDAPEYRQTCLRGGREEACGHEARQALAALLASGGVRCDGSGRDRYGRTLAICTAGGRDLNREMVLAGHAVAVDAYHAEEQEARRWKRGVWATVFERPADWRARHPRPVE